MELCKGGTLKEWIDQKNSENDRKRRNSALCIFQQVVDGVKYIHSQKLIHRDLKHKLIEGMLSEKPELRPDALKTASELTKYWSYLKKDQRALQEMKTM
ncbi:hypothetical protein JZ751_010929 [Albula glossodonta]|uniref:Protein kinase domain-containing protein n=1 Tax=Albula glossodonta TaxID=121402 RepID=A0A8T2NY25_9TELE|nr:hypothetical protein JZ751_010929 [Albula glossodonta]